MTRLSSPLKAFTIMEMMVGLTLAALVVSIGFYGLQLVMKQYDLFQKTTTEAQDYRHFEALVWVDFTAANWVERQNDTSIVCTNDSIRIVYTLHSNLVVRAVQSTETSFEDTIVVKTLIQSSSMDGKPITGGLMDNCLFSINPYGETYRYAVRKIYSAEERMAYEKQHEH